MKSGQLSGAAALAFAAMMGSASAGTFSGTACSGACNVTVITSGSNYTPPSPLPFVPLDLGSTATTGFVSNGTLNSGSTPPIPAGSGISSISFANGTAPGSGLYAGNDVGVALSPFGGPTDGSGDTTGGQNYLVAQGGGGTVTINYISAQTSVDILWGTVDSSPTDYNQLSFTAGGQTVTGADIAAIVGGTFTAANLDVAVEITGLNPFTTVTATDNATPAFEFAVANAPAPPIGHGLPAAFGVGGLLFGARLWGRGKTRFSLGAA